MKRGLLFFCCLLPVLLAACGETGRETPRGPADLVPSLTWQEPDKLDAAEAFTLTRSQEGYILAEIPDDCAAWLVVPEGQPVPKDLPVHAAGDAGPGPDVPVGLKRQLQPSSSLAHDFSPPFASASNFIASSASRK